MPVSDPSDPEDGWTALTLSAVAAAMFYPLATYGPRWWRGARLDDMDAPFDLEWLHNGFAWMAQYIGPVLFWWFAGTVLVLAVVAPRTAGFRTGPPSVMRAVRVAQRMSLLTLVGVAALAVGWLLCTQIAALIAPFLGMYHGEINPAVP